MDPILERYKRHATLLDSPTKDVSSHVMGDIRELMQMEAEFEKPRLANLARAGVPTAAGTQWYNDTKPPFQQADFPTITLSTTSLMMWDPTSFSQTLTGDWWAGKLMYIRAFGKITTALTPGNLTIELRYGTTDNGGTILCTSAALTLIASQTNISWRVEFRVRCRASGTTSTALSLQGTGVFECDTAVIAAGQALLPRTAPAAVTSLSPLGNNGLNVQLKRSGSTAETATVVDMEFQHLN